MTHALTNPFRVVFASFLAFALVAAVLFAPTPARAASLTEPQMQSILSLLGAFGADTKTIKNTEAVLRGDASNTLSCGISSDKKVYDLGETIVFSWRSTNATWAAFIPDTSGKDALVVPGDKQEPAGSTKVIASVFGTPQVVMQVSDAAGATSTCSASVTVVNATSSPITVTAPNGGEKWEVGWLNTITWSPYSYMPTEQNPARDVSVYLEKKVDGQFVTLGKVMDQGKASLHTYFNIDSYDKWAEPGEYYVRAVNNKTGAADRSDNPFTLLQRGVDLKLNGSDDSVVVSDNEPLKVTLVLSGDIRSCLLYGVRLSPQGNYSGVSVPIVAGQTNTYVLYAFGPSNGNASSVSATCTRTDGESRGDSVGIFGKQTESASLKVVSPNGGEKIEPGRMYAISWQQTGLRSVSIALYKHDRWLKWITKDLSVCSSVQVYSASISPALPCHDNSLAWIPEDDIGGPVAAMGKSFKIYITGVKADGTGYVDDKSDSAFEFVARRSEPIPGTSPSVSISVYPTVVPKLGTVYVTWSTSGTADCHVYTSDSTHGLRSWEDGLSGSNRPNGGLLRDTTFTIRCDSGAYVKEATVKVDAAKNPSASISASPQRVPYGGTSYVSWSADGVGQCSVYVITPGQTSSWNDGLYGSNVPLGGLLTDTTLKLRCDKGVVEQIFLINVEPPAASSMVVPPGSAAWLVDETLNPASLAAATGAVAGMYVDLITEVLTDFFVALGVR